MIPVYFVQIAFQLTELFQIGIDAVIYTDQFTCYIGTWTRRLKFVAILNAALGLIHSKQIFNELCGIYGPQTISMRTVFRWIKAFKAGKFSIEDDIRPGRPKISVTKSNIAAVKIVVEQDARLSVKDIASCTGISEGSVQTILKKRLNLKKGCARWVPHYLVEEQKTQRLKCDRELLKTYKGCNSQVISNLLTGDETCVHMFEPQRRADNKQWKRKDQKRPCIAKRTISSKKMLYAIFFNSSGPVVQVPCPSGHTVTGRFYKTSVLKKVKEFYNKKRPSKGWSGVHLLHDNASSHKCEVVKSFLASEKVKVLNHQPYSPDLSPCDFFFYFQGLRKCFLEINIRLEVLLAALFISVSNIHQKKTIYLLFATG